MGTSVFEWEFRIRTGGGAWVWMDCRGRVIDRNPHGLPERVIGTQSRIVDRNKANKALEELAGSVSWLTGNELYEKLVCHLRELFQANYVLIGVLSPDDGEAVDTLKVCCGNRMLPDLRYELHGTPCQNVVNQRDVCFYRSSIQAQFPEDKLLTEMGVESYVGTPIIDRKGQVIGVIAILDERPINAGDELINVLKVASTRVAAELDRIETEQRMRDATRNLSMHVEKTRSESAAATRPALRVPVLPNSCQT